MSPVGRRDPPRPRLGSPTDWAGLLDPARAADRRTAARARGRTRFGRSLAVLEQQSLRAVTDDVCRQFLVQRLGRPLPPGPLPDGIWEALALLQTHNISLPLFDRVPGRRAEPTAGSRPTAR